MAAFAGSGAEFDVQLSDALLARVHFTVRTPPGQCRPRIAGESRHGWPPPRGAGTTSCAMAVDAVGEGPGWSGSSAGLRASRSATASASAPAPPCPTC